MHILHLHQLDTKFSTQKAWYYNTRTNGDYFMGGVRAIAEDREK
jgi:hypothetical protein